MLSLISRLHFSQVVWASDYTIYAHGHVPCSQLAVPRLASQVAYHTVCRSRSRDGAATMLTSRCTCHMLPLTHYALSTTGWMVVHQLFILQLAYVVIQHFFVVECAKLVYKIELAHGLNRLVTMPLGSIRLDSFVPLGSLNRVDTSV